MAAHCVAWTAAILMTAPLVESPLIAQGRAYADDAHVAAGNWLRRHSQPPDTLVAYEIGKVAYLSGLRTIDLLGLTEPRARIHLRQRDLAWAIRELPTYVFSNESPGSWPITDAIFKSAAFARNYRPATRFPFRANLDNVIYRRENKVERPESDEGRSSGRWVDVHHPTAIARGSTAAYSLTVRNTSGGPWSIDGPAAVSIDYDWLDEHGARAAVEESRTALPCEVGPGERVLVSAKVRAPDRPGSYVLVWRLEREGDEAMGEQVSVGVGAAVVVY